MTYKYQLDHINEGLRLEKQSQSANHSLENELSALKLSFGSEAHILDAGCGAASLGRALIGLYPNTNFNITGIDSSQENINWAKKLNREMNYTKHFKLFCTNLLEMNLSNSYEKVFCRYVLQHVPNRELQLKIVRNLYSSIKPSGELYLVDCYGLFNHIDTKNYWLKDKINQFERDAPLDLNIGIKLRGLLIDIGVEAESIEILSMPYKLWKMEDRIQEATLYEERFTALMPLLTSLFGKEDAKNFVFQFIQELLNPRTLFFPTKVLLKCKK